MFSTGHIIWVGISVVLILLGYIACRVIKPSADRMLKACLCVGVTSEAVKVLSLTRILPVVEPMIKSGETGSEPVYDITGQYVPHLEIAHLPIELCSLMIFFIVAALLIKNGIWKQRLYSLMYVTGVIGGALGIILASITVDFSTVFEYFTSVRVWQYFLYHSMVMTLGLYLGFRQGSEVSLRHLKSTIVMLLALDIPSFYINSVLSQPVYTDGKPTGLVYWSNFFSSYVNPLGLVLTQKWQWLLYLAIRLVLAIVVITSLLWLADKLNTGNAT